MISLDWPQRVYGELACCGVVTRSSMERKVCGSYLGPVKLDTLLPTARHRYNISSKRIVLPAGALTRLDGLHELVTYFGVVCQV